MYCGKCGQLLPDNATVCPSCGEAVDRPVNPDVFLPETPPDVSDPQPRVPVVYCRNCGQPVHPDALVCPRCGQPLSPYAGKPERRWIGICAIIFGALGGWLGLVLGIVGLCSSKDRSVRKNCKIGIALFIGWVLLLGFLLLSEPA